MLRHTILPLLLLSGCIPIARPMTATPADPEAIKAQQREGMARSMGYPTRKAPAELEAAIAHQTEKFHRTGKTGLVQLESPEPFVFDGIDGTCYTVVMRLGEGAAWGIAGDYAKFDFQRPDIAGSGGPGVIGPGAIASVGCAKASGPITLAIAPMVAGDSLGSGPLTLELYSHVLTREERRRLEEDERRQIEEQREFARQEREREARRREEDDRRRERERMEASRARSSTSSSGGGSRGPVSVTIRSACGHTVPVFYGSKPRYGSGTSSSISSNSVQSRSFGVGDMMWVTDASGNGLDGVTVSERTRTLEIGCTRIVER